MPRSPEGERGTSAHAEHCTHRGRPRPYLVAMIAETSLRACEVSQTLTQSSHVRQRETCSVRSGAQEGLVIEKRGTSTLPPPKEEAGSIGRVYRICKSLPR